LLQFALRENRVSEIVGIFKHVAIGTVLLTAVVVLPATRTSPDSAVDYRNADRAFESSCQGESACRYPVYSALANKPVARDDAPARAALMARGDSDVLVRLFIVGTVIEGLSGLTRPNSSGLESSTPLQAFLLNDMDKANGQGDPSGSH
jgi:hypothetical protein